MSAPQNRRDQAAEHLYALVEDRAKRKGCRVKKLNGQGARDTVMNSAAWRLIRNQQRFGNIRDYVEGGFWHDASDARDKLIDRALDAERKAYIRATAASGGSPCGEPENESAWENIASFVQDRPSMTEWQPGRIYRDEPLYLLEQQKFEAEEVAALDAREKIEAEENERLRVARNAYAEELTNIRHRRALFLICADPKASNSTIAAQVGLRSVRGIKPETVSKIRDKLTKLADGILTRSPEDLYMEELECLAAVKKAEAEVRRVERQLQRRKEKWLQLMSVEEYEAYRTSTFLAEAAALFGMTADALLGSNTDTTLSATIAPKENA